MAEHAKDWAALVQTIEQRGVPAWLKKSLDVAAATIAGGLNMLGLNEVIITGTLAGLPPAAAGAGLPHR